MDLKLVGMRALVTGSTAGIGLATAAGLYTRRSLGHHQRPNPQTGRRGDQKDQGTANHRHA